MESARLQYVAGRTERAKPLGELRLSSERQCVCVSASSARVGNPSFAAATVALKRGAGFPYIDRFRPIYRARPRELGDARRRLEIWVDLLRAKRELFYMFG